MLRKSWYSIPSVRCEIIKNLMFRETSFFPFEKVEDKWKQKIPIRWLKIHCLDFFDKNALNFRFYDEPMNVYSSLATYNQMPMFSFDWKMKSQQQKVWMEEFDKHIIKYDCFIETDAEDLKDSFRDAVKIKTFLDEYKVRYTCNASGSKGVHIVIPYEEFIHFPVDIYDRDIESDLDFPKFIQKFPIKSSELKKNTDLVMLFKVLNFRLSGLLGCDTLDTSISDIKRVKKVAYSWDVKRDTIALPLTDEQLLNFNIDMIKPDNVLKMNVFKRGLLYRNDGTCHVERKVKMLKMFEDLEIIKV